MHFTAWKLLLKKRGRGQERFGGVGTSHSRFGLMSRRFRTEVASKKTTGEFIICLERRANQYHD